MRDLVPAAEDDMVCAFVRAEIASPAASGYIVPCVTRAGYDLAEFTAGLAAQGQERDPKIVEVARAALAFRGYGMNAALFAGFPADVRWYRGELQDIDFATMRYGSEPSWVRFVPSRLVRDGALAVLRGSTDDHARKVEEIARDMNAGKTYDEIIVVHDGNGALVLLEGWHRATAYAVCNLTDAVPAFIGVSAQMASWIWFS